MEEENKNVKAGAQAMLQVRAGRRWEGPQQSQFERFVYWDNVIIKLGDLLSYA